MPPLRDKQALVMEGGDAAHLVTTPPDPPFLSTQHFEIAGKLNNGGTLEAEDRGYLPRRRGDRRAGGVPATSPIEVE